MQIYKVLFLSAIGVLLMLCSSCNKKKTLGETCLSLSASIAQNPGSGVGKADYETYADLVKPPLPPDQALEKFRLEEGFDIEIVAHEPMIISPVAMDIDPDGRLWVVDMPSYMPVHDMDEEETLRRERVPVGRVTVLEDTNGDGKMDSQRVFADSLTLPRAIKVLPDGVLVGEPPNLWFIRDTTGDGKGDSKEMISSYGDTVNTTVQVLPSALMWGIDNWIHSAGDGAESIRRIDGRWRTRSFKRLGQWGLSQDNWGRFYSSSNSWPLQMHFVPYGYSDRHPLFEMSTGKNVRIAPNEPIWPAHVTGVNRGYREGMLRADRTLRKNTAASSTMIYRGDQFGDEYVGNAFTPEPAGNLIHRLIIDGDPSGIEASAQFAYEDHEFLTSTDERFRPVNIYNAPDGSIYVLDMYRGLFEYVLFLTDYLYDYTVKHDLHKANGMFGRIWRITREDRKIDYKAPRFSDLTPDEVADYLRHDNGWLRDQAQQLLVQCSPDDIIPSLEEMAREGDEEAWTRLHALWTLEGIDRSVYSRDRLNQIALQSLNDKHPRIRASAIRILEPAITQNSDVVFERLKPFTETEPSSFVQLQLLASLGESSSETALELMATILNKHADSPYFREMALTGVYQREQQLAGILQSKYGWNREENESQKSVLVSLTEAEKERVEVDWGHLTEAQRNLFESGRQLYSTCITCHGPEGQGVSGIGPSLAGSEWVQGDPAALVRILLQGFDGGAAERGEDISGVMPGHGYLSDKDVASILTFLRQSWGNKAPPVDSTAVARIRAATDERNTTWSPDELRKLQE